MTQTTSAFVFDAYGTLFDVHSAVGKLRSSLGEHADAISALWRTKQLEYSWLRSLMRRHVDFWQVTTDALNFAFATYSINDNALKTALLDAYLRLDPYPEVQEVLQTLKARGYRTAILSNGSTTMLKAAVDNAQLMDTLDACLSIDPVGIYKPDPSVYQYALDELGINDPGTVQFQSSNAWDVAGAASFGFNVTWINRFKQQRENLGFHPSVELNDLRGLLIE